MWLSVTGSGILAFGLYNVHALSGVTVLGAMIAVATAAFTGSKVLAVIAIALAMLNVAGGFLVTHRMLLMFGHKKEKEEKEA